MKLKAPNKVKQQRRVVLLALYLLKNRFGAPCPPKRKVLRFIHDKRLMHVPEDEKSNRSTGEEVWKNDLSWKREDLKEEGLLRMPGHGVWQITEYGERNVELWAQHIKEFTEKKPDWIIDFKACSDPETEFDDDLRCEFYITEETVRWALKIATNTLR